MTEPELAVVFSPREWADRVVRHMTDHDACRVRLRVLEGRVVLQEEFDLLLIDDITSFLNLRLVQELHRRRRGILGVYDPGEPTGRNRLLELGVDDVIECSASSEEFVRRAAFAPTASDIDHELAQITAGVTPNVDGGDCLDPAPRGLVTAVGGPAGGCGATEVAVELARAAADRGQTSVLVDADDLSPSVAQRLGLPLVPNVQSAVEALLHRSVHLTDALGVAPSGDFYVLAGLANPSDWSQIRALEVAVLIQELAALSNHVIMNVGSQLEDLTRFGGPDRYGLSRGTIEIADQIVGVSAPTPVGVARLHAWLAQLGELLPTKPTHLVINKASDSSFIAAEIAAEIHRTYIPATLHFLPFDSRVEAAAWRGELVKAGAFKRAVARAAVSILPHLGTARGEPIRQGSAR